MPRWHLQGRVRQSPSPPRARARRTCPRARGGGGDERDSGSNAARIPLSNPATRETREDETGDLGPGEGDLEGCRQPSGKKPSGECDLRRDPRPSPLTRARLGSETRVSRTTRTPSAYDGTPRPGTDERAPCVAVHNGPMRSDSKQTTHHSYVRSPACDVPHAFKRNPPLPIPMASSHDPPKHAESACTKISHSYGLAV